MTTTPSKTTRTILTQLVPDAEVKLSKADKRKAALARWRTADDAATVACDERKSAKDDALALCDDGKTYKDADGHGYLIQKEAESTDYSGTLKWALGASNPLNLNNAQKKALQSRLDESKKPRAHTTPIKRLD